MEITDGRIVERYGVHEVMSLMIPGESLVLRGIATLFAHAFFWNSEKNIVYIINLAGLAVSSLSY